MLNNLTGNALAHCAPGGHVHIHVMRQAAGVRVSIADDGEGIAPADLPHVFERFYRGEKSRKREKASGMGLGLVIARELVQAHGGAIGIESAPGAGATAWFTLP